jgi:hypothetical protein
MSNRAFSSISAADITFSAKLQAEGSGLVILNLTKKAVANMTFAISDSKTANLGKMTYVVSDSQTATLDKMTSAVFDPKTATLLTFSMILSNIS